MTLVINSVSPKSGAIPLPVSAEVVPMVSPQGQDLARKLWLLRNLVPQAKIMIREIRRADVVHVPLPGDVEVFGYLLALFMGKRLIIRYGGSWKANSETTLWNRVTRLLMRLTAGPRRLMLATGAGDIPPAARIHWLFATALSRREVQSVAVDINRIPGKRLCLAYAGRLSPEKGLLYLIRAMGTLKADEEMKDRCPVLKIVGDGPQRSELVDAVHKEGLETTITFAGQLDRVALLRTLLASDVCVFPSLSEGFCKAHLDALVCGVPILSSDVGSARAVVGSDGERGWLCNPGDASALAGRLKQIIMNPPDWVRLKTRCRAFAEPRTVESWTEEIGLLCAREWGIAFTEGRLQS